MLRHVRLSLLFNACCPVACPVVLDQQHNNAGCHVVLIMHRNAPSSVHTFVCCTVTRHVAVITLWTAPSTIHTCVCSVTSPVTSSRRLLDRSGIAPWKVHLASWRAWLMLHLSGQVWNMPALYGILTSSRTVMHWRESRGGLLAGSQVSTIGVQAYCSVTPASPWTFGGTQTHQSIDFPV